MKETHTPGPWIADGSRRVQGNRDYHRYDICYLYHVPVHLADVDSRVANANLIAAAPELLAALKAVMSFAKPTRGVFCDSECLGTCDECKALALARNAIAKAEGN